MRNRSEDQHRLAIAVGTVAVAVKASAVFDAGEIGVCYELYQLNDRPGYSFIFADGGYDGFSTSDVLLFLALPGLFCDAVQDYEFRSALTLQTDYRRGVSAPAFAMAVPPLGQLRQ